MSRFAFFAFLFLTALFPLSADRAGSSGSGEDRTELGAAELYESGQYTEAAGIFLEEGGVNAVYNSARSWHEDYLVNGDASSLDLAVEGYYRALDLDPGSPEALKNLELARREQEKNQSAEEQRNRNSQSSPEQGASAEDQLNQMADRQQELADNSSGAGAEADEGETRKQQDLQDQTNSAATRSSSSDVQKALQQAAEEQQKAMDAMEQGEDASEAQNRAAEALRKAARAAGEQAGQEKGAQAQESEGQETGEGSEDPSEGLPEDLQSMLNAEQDRRKNEDSPDDRIMVEKNW